MTGYAILLPVEIREDQAKRLAKYVTWLVDPHDNEEDARVVELTDGQIIDHEAGEGFRLGLVTSTSYIAC